MYFNDIFLSARSYEQLEELSCGAALYLHRVDAQLLLEYGFIAQYYATPKYVITSSGLLYLEYCQNELKKEAQLRKEQRCHDWALAIITALLTAILTNVDRIIKYIATLLSNIQ